MGKKCHERFWPQVSQIKLLTRFVSLQKKYSWLYKVRLNAVSRHEANTSKIPFFICEFARTGSGVDISTI